MKFDRKIFEMFYTTNFDKTTLLNSTIIVFSVPMEFQHTISDVSVEISIGDVLGDK